MGITKIPQVIFKIPVGFFFKSVQKFPLPSASFFCTFSFLWEILLIRLLLLTVILALRRISSVDLFFPPKGKTGFFSFKTTSRSGIVPPLLSLPEKQKNLLD